MSFDSSNTYATINELKLRVTRHGFTWAADVDDGDGFVHGDSPEAAYPEEAIEYANVLVDEALSAHVSVIPRPANAWCKDRAIDIAAARLFSLGGKKVPAPLQAASDLAIDKLEQARDGLLNVPGLNYSAVVTGGRRAGYPVAVINLGCR